MGSTEALHAESLASLEWHEIQRMVADRTVTPQGAVQASAMLPDADREVVRRERRRTLEAVGLLREAGRMPFRGLKELDASLRRLEVDGGRLEAQEFYELCLMLRTAAELKSFVLSQVTAGVELAALETLAREIPDLTELLHGVESHVSSSGEVVDTASAELRKIRRRRGHLSEKLTRELEKISDRADAGVFLRDEYITVRNGRFVLPIRTDSPVPVPGILHGRSSTGLTHFVEPLSTVEINNEIVGLREAEEEEIDRILRDYFRRFQVAREPVRETVRLVGRFDLVQARARLAEETNAVAAEESERLTLVDARHPILEESLAAQGKRPVPICLELGGEERILIISGPNTGGKTVALKTVGLLVLMNQAGLLVPAATAALPVFRRVLVDIGDHQSIAANLSTFSAHMRNIGWMSGQVEPPTLVLLDEIGTGTDPEEGAALGVAILEDFRRQGALVVVTTHMSGVKSHGYETAGVQNACVEFNEETLEPTFRILLGVAGSSSGIEIARRLGLPESVVSGARRRLGTAGEQADLYLRRLKESLEKAACEREHLEDQARELGKQREREKEKAAKQEMERARIFREQLQAAVERYEKTLHDHLRTLRDKSARRKLEREGARRRERVEGAIEAEASGLFARSGTPHFTPATEVSPGDSVQIPSLGQSGVVEEVGSSGRIRVAVGSKTLTVTLAEVALVEPSPAEKDSLRRPAKRVLFQSAPRKEVPHELHLVGRTVDEALPLLDKFLDDAFLAEHQSVRVVHGHGTGVLRRAIAEFLKTHPHVANYRLAEDREGGTAVTVVDLRD